MLTPFHIAVAVRDIPETREFYGGKQGARFFAGSGGNALEFEGFKDIDRALFDAS